MHSLFGSVTHTHTHTHTHTISCGHGAGETLEIVLTNNLLDANNLDCANNLDFCETAITNLHTHGLHVSSKGRRDNLDYYSDDVMAEVAPGGSETFKFAIPDYHMPGTHWYHPHHHHATALQAGGGAAGAALSSSPKPLHVVRSCQAL
eukprot:6488673-Amphidinium_carterae.1